MAAPHGSTLAYRFVIVPAGQSFTPGTADTLPDSLFYITSKYDADHPWIESPPGGDGQRIELPLGHVSDSEYQVRVIDVAAPIQTISCGLPLLLQEGNAGLDQNYLTSGGWTVEDDYGTTTFGPHTWWGATASEPRFGGFALFSWGIPYDGGPWVRSSWIKKTFDGTEAGGAHWTAGQQIGVHFRVLWSLDSGAGNMFAEANGVRISFPNGSYDFWTIDPDLLPGSVFDGYLYTTADANGEIEVKLGGENFAPSCNTYAEFRDLEFVTCTNVDVGVEAERYVTGWLADDNARQRLLGRPAYLEESTDGGLTWSTVLYAGYVKQIEMERSLTFLFTLGDAGRGQRVGKAWADLSPFDDATFEHVTLVQGGVHKGYEPILADAGYRRYVANAVYTDPDGIENAAVVLDFVSGPTPDTIAQIAARAGGYLVPRTWPYGHPDITGSFPGLSWYLLNPSTLAVVKAGLMPIGLRSHLAADALEVIPQTSHVLQWDDATGPVVSTEYFAIQCARVPSDVLPLFLLKHPVDIATALMTAHGISYDSASATTCKTQMGEDILHQEGITNGNESIQDVLDRFAETYRFCVRRGTDGVNEFVYFGDKISTLPAATIDMDTVRAEGGPVFSLSDATRITRVRVTGGPVAVWDGSTETREEYVTRRFLGLPVGVKTRRWKVPSPSKPASGLQIEPAEIVFDYSTDGSTPDADIYGEQEASIELGGVPAWPGGHAMNLSQFGEGLARRLFDPHGRGRQLLTIPLLRGTVSPDPQLADTVTVTLDHLPNAQLGQSPTSQRGGSRPFRVVQRTDEVAGPVVQLADEGTGVQFGTVPALSIAPGASAFAPYFLNVTVTNASTFTAAAAQIEFQVLVFPRGTAVDLSDPGFHYTVQDSTPWTDSPHTLRLGEFPAWATVYVRARAWLFGGAASDWSNWYSIGGEVTGAQTTLSDLHITAITDDGATLTWTVDESPAVGNVKVQYRVTSVGGAYTTFATLAPGTTTDDLTGLTASTQYDVRVVLDNGSEYGDVLTGSFTTQGGALASLVVGTPTADGVALSWTNTDTDNLVRVQAKLDTAASYFTVIDLAERSTNYTIAGLQQNTAYDVRVVLIDPATGVEVGTALTGSFTTGNSPTTLSTPTSAAVFGGYNPLSAQNAPGTYGLQVVAVFGPPGMLIVFHEATETAVGSGTAGTYAEVARTPGVVGGLTYYVATAPNDGKLRYLKAYAEAPGYTDSAFTTALSVDPWPDEPSVPDPHGEAIGALNAFGPRVDLMLLRHSAIQSVLGITAGGGGGSVTADSDQIILATQVYGA